MKKWKGAVLALLAGLTVLVAPSPAHAEAAPVPAAAAPGCDIGEFCIHKTSTAAPYWVKTPPELPANACVTVSPQDFTRYVSNRTQYDVDVWLTGSCSGTRATMIRYTSGPMNDLWDDRIRSVARRSASAKTGIAPSPLSVPIGCKSTMARPCLKSGQSVPIAYHQTVLPPSPSKSTAAPAVKAARANQCASGTHGSQPNANSPYGTQWCVSANWERNTCLRATAVGPTFGYSYNDTQYRWLVFRVSDTTCSGAACGSPPFSQGGPGAYCSGWTTYGPKMRTSATS